MPLKTRYGQIAVYPDDALRKKIESEAKAEGRKLGPWILELIKSHFRQKEKAK
jgi:hypothetical protein